MGGQAGNGERQRDQMNGLGWWGRLSLKAALPRLFVLGTNCEVL